MPDGSWEAFYRSDLQAVYALWVAPLGFLVARAVLGGPAPGDDPRAARFVAIYTLAWALETLLDPWATGPLARALGSEAGATGLSLLFVLLGDFRVYWLVFALAAPEEEGPFAAGPLRRAALWTPAVALFALAIHSGLEALWGPLSPHVLYLIHELAFAGVALFLARRLVPREVARPGRRAFLRDVLAYVAVYYALWAFADVMILAGYDEGWALRAVPNQLYYGLYVPFVALRFRASRRASSSTSTHASR